MKKILYLYFGLSLMAFSVVWGQSNTPNREIYRLNIKPVDEPLKIDGLLDDQAWKIAEVAGDFHRVLPIDTGFASAQTDVMLSYDQTNLYMAIICHDTVPGKRPVESLRRDFSFGKNDNFLVCIDTYNDKTNGFAFGISAAGAQWEGVQANGGFVSLDWDCKWRSAVQNYPDRWVAEFAIPFRSIRYRDGITEWGINFSRLDLKQNEKSTWAPVPRQFQSVNLAYTGTLVWDKAPPKLGTRFSLIPYVAGQGVQDVTLGEEMDFKARIGGDAKITLSTSMNLDLTVNPDFSQVEVDRQVTNLDRFELFFPERRQFFLENSDLFASLGAENIRPFFSRRIGLNSPVRAGARLSGKLGEKWRIGLMNMQTGTEGEMPASNFSVAAVQRQIFDRSNIGVFMVNKQVTIDPSDSVFNGLRYNRVAGIDLNLASADNNWTGKVFYHQSFYEKAGDKAFVFAGNVAYNTQQWAISWDQAWIGDNYLAEVGFVRRRGLHRMNPSIGYKFYPANAKIANHGPKLSMGTFWDPKFKLTDRETEFDYTIQWLNRSEFQFSLEEQYIRLLDNFDPTNTGNPLKEGEEFSWQEIGISYTSDGRKLFNYILSTRYGGFFSGNRWNVEATANYRVQPYGSLGVFLEYNKLNLPAPQTKADFVLLGPRLDLTFTDKLFLTSLLQYNTQRDNLGVFVRFQWRYAPVSDFFFVYRSDAHLEGMGVHQRLISAKLSYWLN